MTLSKFDGAGAARARRRLLCTGARALIFVIVAAAAALASSPVAASNPVAAQRPASDEAEARGALEHAFRELRAGNFDALYETLPASARRQITRARFAGMLGSARGMYELDKLEISRIRVAGNLAVADTVVYGRVRRPIEGEGKIVARQYMVRESGRWRVTTGDRATVGPLLAAKPSFARQFPAAQPRFFLKRDGQWIDVSSLIGRRRRGLTNR